MLLLFAVVSLFSCKVYYVDNSDASTNCTEDNPCGLERCFTLINNNHDPNPTLQFSKGTYEIDNILSFYYAEEIQLLSSVPGEVVISRKYHEGVNKTIALFSLSGTPKMTVNGVYFENIQGVEHVFYVKDCWGLEIVFENSKFDFVEVKKAVFGEVVNVTLIEFNKLSYTNSSMFMNVNHEKPKETTIGTSNRIIVDIRSSSISCLQNGFLRMDKLLGELVVSIESCTVSQNQNYPVFYFGSLSTQINVTNSEFLSNEVTVVAVSSISSVFLSGNQVFHNLIQDVDTTSKYLFDFRIGDHASSFISVKNQWVKNNLGLIRITRTSTFRQNKDQKKNYYRFDHEYVSFNNLISSSESLVYLSDSSPDIHSQITLFNLSVSNNDITGSPCCYEGTITISLCGKVDLDVYYGNYILNTARSGGAINFVDSACDSSTTESEDSFVFIDSVFFRDNEVEENGGAIFIDRNLSTLRMNVVQSHFEQNSAENGGAILFRSIGHTKSYKTCFNMSHTEVTGNTAKVFGGGILVHEETCQEECFLFIDPDLKTQNLITKNTAEFGGGIYFVETFQLGYDINVVRNNTATSNIGNDVYTSPQKIGQKISSETSIYISCTQDQSGVECTTEDEDDEMTIEFFDGYGNPITIDTFEDFEVGLEFSTLNEADWIGNEPSDPLDFDWSVKSNILGKNVYSGDVDGNLALSGNTYQATLQFPSKTQSFFQMYHVYIIIFVLVALFLVTCCLCTLGTCCVCCILIHACRNSPFFDGFLVDRRRKKEFKGKTYEAINTLNDDV